MTNNNNNNIRLATTQELKWRAQQDIPMPTLSHHLYDAEMMDIAAIVTKAQQRRYVELVLAEAHTINDLLKEADRLAAETDPNV